MIQRINGLLLLYCLTFSLFSFGFSGYTDSLIQRLQFEQDDSVKVMLCYDITAEVTYSDPDSSIYFCEYGISLAEKIPFPKGGALLIMELGTIHMYKSEYSEALKYTFRALDIFQFINDKRGMASANGNAGIIFWYMEDYKKSLDYYEESVNQFFELGDSVGVARQYNNMGLIRIDQTEYDLALNLFSRSSEINLELGLDNGQAKCLNNMAIAYENKEDWEKAEEYYKQAIEIRDKTGDLNGMVISMNNLGDLLSKQGKLREAEKYLNESLRISTEMDFPEAKRYAHEYLSNVFFRLNNHQQAYLHLREFKALEDSLKKIDVHEEVAEIEARFQTEKKEREIQELEREKVERSLYLEQEKASSRMKTIILTAVILGFVIVLLIMYNVFRSYRNKKEIEIVDFARQVEILREKVDRQLENQHSSEPVSMSKDEINKHFIDPLTDREFEILELVTTGKTNKEIADSVFVSENTVKYHLKNIYLKLDVKNRTEALAKVSGISIRG